MIPKEYFVDLQEKFEKVKKLIEQDSQFDPEAEPYFSKYAARQNLLNMNKTVCELRDKYNCLDEAELTRKLLGMQATVQLQLAIIAIDTEEFSYGEQHLNECMKTVENYEYLPEVASITLNMYNHFGILWSKRENLRAKEYLDKAHEFYTKIIDSKVTPVDINDIFTVDFELDVAEANKKFEKCYTLTLFYLAQIYGTIDPLKSAVLCHKTLQRQYDSNEYDHIDWALNTATLAQFFMERKGFKQARHHLCASSFVLDKYETLLQTEQTTDEQHEHKMEVFRHRSADVARCWAKYGLFLLSSSKERLLRTDDNINDLIALYACTDISKMDLPADSSLTKEDLLNFDFSTIDLSVYEIEITCNYLLTLEEAKHVFLNVQKWLKKAQDYYTLDTLASDHTEIALEHSKLYDALVFFEESPENQTKLLKRSVDILENVLKQINPTYYMSYCRQMWFRCGILYSDILDIKLDRLKSSTNNITPTAQALTKINTLVDKSVNHFMSLLNSVGIKDESIAGKLPEECEKAAVQACFHIAAIQMRYITMDKNAKLLIVEKCLKYYKMIVNYCQENENLQEELSTELSVAKEMVQLLPHKILRLENDLKYS